eukprot:g9964.t1
MEDPLAPFEDELLPPKPPKVEEEASIQDKKIDAQALSSLGQRHKTAPSQQERAKPPGSCSCIASHGAPRTCRRNGPPSRWRGRRTATRTPTAAPGPRATPRSPWSPGVSTQRRAHHSRPVTVAAVAPPTPKAPPGRLLLRPDAPGLEGRLQTSSGGDLEQATTLLISNMPIYLTQGALLSMFEERPPVLAAEPRDPPADAHGEDRPPAPGTMPARGEDLTTTMRGKFDFFYCPWDHKAGHNFGYAIINFTDVAHANEFQQQWTNKDLFRSGRGSKTMKVSKATLQGFDANVDYFRKAEIGGRCRDLRFRPLYRDGEGKLQHLELALPGGVQPRKPGAAEVNHHLRKVTRAADIPKEPDTGQGGESKKAAVLGTSRPEERSRSQVEERRGRPRKRRPDMAEASAAAEAPPPSTPLPEQQEVMPGVQPHDIWQKMSLQQQQQELGPHSRRLY